MREHHLVHAHGEREIVRRILEQRIAADVHFVEVDARQERRQPEGLLVGDEVDLVPALRERDAELRRDRAGAAVRGIAGDADLHATPPPSTTQRARRPIRLIRAQSGHVLAGELMPEPGALPLGVLSCLDHHALLRLFERQLPPDHLTNRAIARCVPGRRVVGNNAHQRAAPRPASRARASRRARLDAERKRRSRIDDKISRAPTRCPRVLAMQVAHPAPREQRDLDGAQQLRAAEVRAIGIERADPAAQARRWSSASDALERRASPRASSGGSSNSVPKSARR